MRSDEDHLGPGVAELLSRFGQPAVEFTASGSAALEVALEVLGIGRGDEVIVPDIGCHSVAAAVVRAGATAVFVSVGDALTLSPDDVAKAYSTRTRAVIATHQYGLPCDVPGIVGALPRDVPVIEDVAQTWDSWASGVIAGSTGALAITSFGRSKPVVLGAGGALLGTAPDVCGTVARGDVRDRYLPRAPSGARFPTPLLDRLPQALLLADRTVAARRKVVEQFLGDELSAHFRLPPVKPNSRASWTRLPLYPKESVSNTHLERVRAVFGPIQRMHTTPPSKLPMFQDRSKLVVHASTRAIEPLLVKIG